MLKIIQSNMLDSAYKGLMTQWIQAVSFIQPTLRFNVDMNTFSEYFIEPTERINDEFISVYMYKH